VLSSFPHPLSPTDAPLLALSCDEDFLRILSDEAKSAQVMLQEASHATQQLYNTASRAVHGVRHSTLLLIEDQVSPADVVAFKALMRFTRSEIDIEIMHVNFMSQTTLELHQAAQKRGTPIIEITASAGGDAKAAPHLRRTRTRRTDADSKVI